MEGITGVVVRGAWVPVPVTVVIWGVGAVVACGAVPVELHPAARVPITRRTIRIGISVFMIRLFQIKSIILSLFGIAPLCFMEGAPPLNIHGGCHPRQRPPHAGVRGVADFFEQGATRSDMSGGTRPFCTGSAGLPAGLLRRRHGPGMGVGGAPCVRKGGGPVIKRRTP